MRYNKEFKENAIKLVLAKEEHQSMLEIAKKLGVSKATLYKWIKQAQQPTKT